MCADRIASRRIGSDRSVTDSPSTKHAHHGIRLKNSNDAAIVALRRSCCAGSETTRSFSFFLMVIDLRTGGMYIELMIPAALLFMNGKNDTERDEISPYFPTH